MNDITKTSVHWNVNYSFDARFPNTQEDEGGMVQKEFMLYFSCLFLSS